MRKLKIKIYFIGCLLVASSLILSCSKDNPLNPLGNCYDGNWANQYANELAEWSNAATAYSEDPTPANCESFKTAAKNYLDALREVADCVPTVNRAEINDAINEAKADVDQDGCD